MALRQADKAITRQTPEHSDRTTTHSLEGRPIITTSSNLHILGMAHREACIQTTILMADLHNQVPIMVEGASHPDTTIPSFNKILVSVYLATDNIVIHNNTLQVRLDHI